MVRAISSQTTSFTSSFLGTSTVSSSFRDPATNPDDPFYIFLRPPPDETSEQRAEREQREADAKRVNDEINEMLRREKAAMKKKGKPVKVLLLGQSESGKSTTLKNFQLTYARKAWEEEHLAWRSVIQLNLCRTVNYVLDILTDEMAFEGALAANSPGDFVASVSPPTLLLSALDIGHSKYDAANDAFASPLSPSTPRSPPNAESTSGTSLPKLNFTEKHKLLKLKLGPLKRVQRDLEMRLGAGALEPSPALAGAAMTQAAPFEDLSMSGSGQGLLSAGDDTVLNSESSFVPPSRRGPQEFYVRSSTGWKAALDRLRPLHLAVRNSSERASELVEVSGAKEARARHLRESEETTRVIAECREDIGALWGDELVKTMLARRKLRLEERGGFFLDDIDRIAVPDYEPSDGDIVRARLRTLGVQEHRFVFEKGMETGQEWLMYDVGGARSLRAAWPPFFDDLNAIIFLAPISCFDEKLAEDRRVNRLEDSFLLWKAVCSNRLLRRTMITLFLNKCDLLEKKLNAGVQFRKYVPSYGAERVNDAECVKKYLKQKFKEMSKQHSPQPRGFFVHFTSVVDTKATAVTLATVREGILRDHLRRADLL